MIIIAILVVGEEICFDIVDGWLCDLDFLALPGSNTVDVTRSSSRNRLTAEAVSKIQDAMNCRVTCWATLKN